MSEALLSVTGLGKVFTAKAGLGLGRASEVRAVDDVSFDIRPGETMALVGESGCGKSTLGRLILQLIPPSSGQVLFEGVGLTELKARPLREMRRRMQMVFQDPFGSLSPRRSVADIVAEPIDAFGLAPSRTERREMVAELLRQVGLPAAVMDRYPRQFSGGQRQRIGIARAIAAGPSFIVADEPVSALDVSVQAQVINLLQDLQESRGLTYLFIAHDLAVVRHIATSVAVMYLGRIVEMGPKREVYATPHHPYTQALLSAAPNPDPDAPRRQIVLRGDVPSPSNVPRGCAFNSRCPMATARCREERPELRTVGAGHVAACHHAAPNPIRLDAATGMTALT
jgi:peptide/nickel transport system ATP-binding protein/oligopeptide transport system ATP-binding protein